MNKDEYSKFLMRVGYNVKNTIINEIITTFPNREDRGVVFHNVIVNIVANIVADVSQAEKIEENMKQIILGLDEWLHGKNIHRVTYDSGKDEIIKEGLH